MKAGVILRNFGEQASGEDLLATARLAERLGFDSIWTTDHVALPKADSGQYGRIFEALITLAYLAPATERIRLGVSSLVLPQRDPVLAAKQIATLDVLSGGRAMLCLGVGWSAGEYANLGQRFSDRGRRLDEAVTVLRLLWGGAEPDGISFVGENVRLREAVFAPAPIQGAALPIWIGGNSPAAIRRAAKAGDGWHPTRLPLDEFGLGVRSLRLQAGGRPITVSLRMRVAFDRDADPGILAGTTTQIAEQLTAYQEAGLEYPVLAFESPHPAADREAMARFAAEVLPQVPDAPP